MRIEELIQKGFLKRIKPNEKMVDKEIKEAEYDIEKARESFGNKDYKWSTIKAYYAMFHASRAVLISYGLKDRRHFAVGMTLEELAKKGKFKLSLIDDFRSGLVAREDADYKGVYFSEVAEHILNIADEFLDEVKKTLKSIQP